MTSPLPPGRRASSGSTEKRFASGAHARIPPVRPGQALKLSAAAYGIRLGAATNLERLAPRRRTAASAAIGAEKFAAGTAASKPAAPASGLLTPGGSGRLFAAPSSGAVKSLQLGRRAEAAGTAGAAGTVKGAASGNTGRLPFGTVGQRPAAEKSRLLAAGDRPTAGSGLGSARTAQRPLSSHDRTEAISADEVRAMLINGLDPAKKPEPARPDQQIVQRSASASAAAADPPSGAATRAPQGSKPPAAGSRAAAPPGSPSTPRKDGKP